MSVQRVTTQETGRLFSKAFNIISAVYRQAKEFDQTNEYMEKSSEVLTFYMHFNVGFRFVFLKFSTLRFLKGAASPGWSGGLP